MCMAYEAKFCVEASTKAPPCLTTFCCKHTSRPIIIWKSPKIGECDLLLCAKTVQCHFGCPIPYRPIYCSHMPMLDFIRGWSTCSIPSRPVSPWTLLLQLHTTQLANILLGLWVCDSYKIRKTLNPHSIEVAPATLAQYLSPEAANSNMAPTVTRSLTLTVIFE